MQQVEQMTHRADADTLNGEVNDKQVELTLFTIRSRFITQL